MMPSLSRSTTPLAQLNAATGVATRDEGALTALTTRSSSGTDSRAKSGGADGAKNRSSVCAALKRDGDSHGKHQGQDDDGVGH
jgi:hypothetical protein